MSDAKRLVAKVVEVVFESDVKTAHAKAAISPPHWKEGEDYFGSNSFSSRAAVILVDGAAGADATKPLTIKVEVTLNENVSGTAVLTGSLGDLEIEGDAEVPTAVGVHTVKAKIKELPDGVRWYNDKIGWGLEVADLSASVALDSTRVEVFAVLERPVRMFASAPGVWSEALRFLCEKAGVVGQDTSEDVMASITSYCHSVHGLGYDHVSGAPHYGGRGPAFQLDSYMKTANGTVVNCYDQAAAVQVLSASLGVDASWEFLQPFGFIPTVNLVGRMCNNPFYLSPGLAAVHPDLTQPVVKAKSRAFLKRTMFGNHAFAKSTGMIYDACAGPAQGQSPADYLAASIDDKSHKRARRGGASGSRGGTVADITTADPVVTVV